jgi:hypothetical protein
MLLRSVPLRDRGAASLKPILALFLFAAFLFAGVRAFPVYFNSSRLADYIRVRAVQAAAATPAPGMLQADVVRYARQLGLPLSPDQVSVTDDHGTLSIKLDYTVPVNLKVFTWKLHFAPWVVSRAY